tara:strand:+ start:283 stop:528 length:246 start_codon:yes stop_codon:yes gene_type:complete
MKNLRYALCTLLVASLIGCNKVKEDGGKRLSVNVGAFGWLAVTELDGCEYVVYRAPKAGSVIHKANCKNPNHIVNNFRQDH